jgi:alkylation response protein AidB-like acyl-CoA dehydrogenase
LVLKILSTSPKILNFILNTNLFFFLYSGEKMICLAITEPWAGSDVSSIKTSAVKSECGKFYIVNGMKKWISTGLYCDLFTTCVRTSDNGMFGLSLLLIEKS